MENCVFCKIASGEFDSAKIWEDSEFLAILDIYPNTKGMTLVLTKKHYDSYAFKMPEDVYSRLMLACRKVGRLLDEKLGVERTAMVIEGMGVNHVHVKLYPLHGLEKEFRAVEAKEKVFFKEYPGYVTTLMGSAVDLKELKKLAEKIKS